MVIVPVGEISHCEYTAETGRSSSLQDGSISFAWVGDYLLVFKFLSFAFLLRITWEDWNYYYYFRSSFCFSKIRNHEFLALSKGFCIQITKCLICCCVNYYFFQSLFIFNCVFVMLWNTTIKTWLREPICGSSLGWGQGITAIHIPLSSITQCPNHQGPSSNWRGMGVQLEVVGGWANLEELLCLSCYWVTLSLTLD